MEFSKQTTEKRKYSTQDTGCFSPAVSELSLDRNEPEKKKIFEVECQAKVFRS